MKRTNWLVAGAVVLCLTIIPLVGCGVSQSEYEALQAEKASLEADLAEIQEVYPPKEFSSLSELRNWLTANDVSEKPDTTYAEDWYGRALEVQEDALMDGYIVSVDYDYYEDDDSYGVWCGTVIDGDIWFWDPETDETFQDYNLGKVK